MPVIFTARLTAAAAVALPASGYHLTKVKLIGGATPGTLSILWNGTGNAVFPVPSTGTTGKTVYDVEWGPLPQTLQAAIFTFGGGLSVAELTFSDAGGKGPNIASFRGIVFRRTDAGAVTATITVSYDEGPAKPRAIIGLTSASAGRAQPPSIGGVQAQFEALVSDDLFDDFVYLMPDLKTAQNSLTLNVITDGASTSQYVVYY